MCRGGGGEDGPAAVCTLASVGVNADLVLPVRLSGGLLFAVIGVAGQRAARGALGD